MPAHLPTAWPHPGVHPVYKAPPGKDAQCGRARAGAEKAVPVPGTASSLPGSVSEGTSGPAHALLLGMLRPQWGKDVAKVTKQIKAQPRRQERNSSSLYPPPASPEGHGSPTQQVTQTTHVSGPGWAPPSSRPLLTIQAGGRPLVPAPLSRTSPSTSLSPVLALPGHLSDSS